MSSHSGSFHFVKRVRIRNYSGPQYSRIFPYSVRRQENAEKMRTRINPNTDSFYAVFFGKISMEFLKIKSY